MSKYSKRKAISPCESDKLKQRNIVPTSERSNSESSNETFLSFEMPKENITDVITIRVLKKNKEDFVGALDRPQAYELWKKGIKLPIDNVTGIGLVQHVDKPFMIDYHLALEIDVLKIDAKFDSTIENHTYECQVVIPKEPPPKLGEEVQITIPKTRFKLKPEQVTLWIKRFGIVVKPAAYVVADDLPGIDTDDLICIAKLRKHIPGSLPAFGRKMTVRYPGQPVQCNKCYQFNHLRAKCENPLVEWKHYVKFFITAEEGSESIVPLEMVGEWQRLL